MKDAINRLIFSLDNDLSPEEQNLLDKALAESTALQAEKTKLLEMRALIENLEIPANPNFTDKVMAGLESSSNRKGKNMEASILHLFPRVAAACILFIAVAFSVIYFSETDLPMDSLVGIDDVMPEEATYVLLDY